MLAGLQQRPDDRRVQGVRRHDHRRVEGVGGLGRVGGEHHPVGVGAAELPVEGEGVLGLARVAVDERGQLYVALERGQGGQVAAAGGGAAPDDGKAYGRHGSLQGSSKIGGGVGRPGARPGAGHGAPGPAGWWTHTLGSV